MTESSHQNILLIQTAFIGDVILTTPMIEAIKKLLPQSRLTVMIKPEARGLLESNPRIDELLIIDKAGAHRGPTGMMRMVREIRSRAFDVILSPHQSHRTGILCALSGVAERFGYRQAGFASLAYTHLLDRPTEMPEILRLLEFLDHSIAPGAKAESTDTHLYETPNSISEAEKILSSLGGVKPILIAPSSVWPTKRWTPWGFAELSGKLAREYRCPILLVGAKGDIEIGKSVMDFVNILVPESERGRIENICGKTSLLGLYSLSRRSRLIISNDSAPVHIASAAKIPIVAIFGPTIPTFGYAPITENSLIAEVEGLSCRPCGSHGGKSCPQGHFLCMKDLTVDMVLGQAKRLLTRV